MTACAYLRKSREDEERERLGRGETLARHKRQLEALAADHGVDIARWYAETASGETIAARPAMRELLRDVAHGKWGAVYCMEAARLGRGGGTDQESILNCLRYTGTRLVTPDKSYDPQSPADMRLLKKELQASEDELDNITTRLTRGKYQAAREGIWQSTGRTPYGWRAVRVGLDWTLEPDENHHHMLRIYDLLEEGQGWQTIANIYNAENVPRARGGKRWTAAAVQAIARNPANCGMVTYAKRKTVREFDPDSFAVVKRKVKNAAPIVARGLHFGNGGIAPERFEAIIGDVRLAKTHADKPLRNPLATLLVCGKCGYTMTCTCGGAKGRYIRYYRHKPARYMTRPCDGCKPARVDVVMDGLLDALADAYRGMEVELDAPNVADRAAALEKELQRCAAQRDRILEAYEAGVYSLDELKARRSHVEARITAIAAELDALPTERPPEAVKASISACIDALRDPALSVEEVNAALRSVISRIEYRNDGEVMLDVYMR